MMPVAVIMVVDDEVLVRLLAAELLREEGFQVLEAASGAEALTLLATGHPLNLVLTDIRMPGMDGVTLAGKIKAARPELPVALVSSNDPGDAIDQVDGWLSKPYREHELLGLVADLTGPTWRKAEIAPIAS